MKYPRLMWIPVVAIYIFLVSHYCLWTDQAQNIWTRLPEFVIGMYIGKYYRKIHMPVFGAALLILLCMLFIPLTIISQMIRITVVGTCSFLICAYVGQHINNHKIQKPFIWVSKYSYAIYLLHHVISEQVISTYEGRVYSAEATVALFLLCLFLDIVGGVYLTKIMKSIYEICKNIHAQDTEEAYE